MHRRCKHFRGKRALLHVALELNQHVPEGGHVWLGGIYSAQSSVNSFLAISHNLGLDMPDTSISIVNSWLTHLWLTSDHPPLSSDPLIASYLKSF